MGIALRQAARDESDPAAADHLRKEANSRQLQLMMVLEQNGRPLAAQVLAERLAALELHCYRKSEADRHRPTIERLAFRRDEVNER